MNRSLARIGSYSRRTTVALVALSLSFFFAAAPSAAAYSPNLWFSGTRLILDHADTRAGTIAVGVTDEGLLQFLARMGATLAYQPGQRYIVVTTADRRTISFTLGDVRYTAQSAALTAPFAPYTVRGEPFLPFYELAKAMYVAPIDLGFETVLQPQIGALDVRDEGKIVIVTLRGATPLRFARVSGSDAARVALQFTGTASTLEQSRVTDAPGLSQITVLVEGTSRAPKCTVAFEAPVGGVHAMYPSQSRNEIVLAFAPAGTALAGTAIPDAGTTQMAESPVPAESQSPAASDAAVVTAVAASPGDQGTSLRIAVSGRASYEWHRLLDNRWYVDIRNATLGVPAHEDTLNTGAVLSMRIKQLEDALVPTVRVALTLPSMRRVDVTPAADGITLMVAALDDEEAPRVGAGRIGPDASILAVSPRQPLAPWKFGVPVGGSRLIVLDPGHGGSDSGAQQNGLTEKLVALDASQRLRALLAARGWTVKMTREADTDVFAPNDSARDELQARCDFANAAGASLFISIHVNSFTSSDLNGTTTYYYKAQDRALADAVHRRLIAAELGTADDGVRKANFYVIRHTAMPAILIETAFMSNPEDAALLRSPAFLQKIASAVADGVGDYAARAQAPVTSMFDQ